MRFIKDLQYSYKYFKMPTTSALCAQVIISERLRSEITNYTHNFIINKIVDFHSKPVSLSKRMFCKMHSIPKSTLDYWLHKYSNGTLFSEKKAGYFRTQAF